MNVFTRVDDVRALALLLISYIVRLMQIHWLMRQQKGWYWEGTIRYGYWKIFEEKLLTVRYLMIGCTESQENGQTMNRDIGNVGL